MQRVLHNRERARLAVLISTHKQRETDHIGQRPVLEASVVLIGTDGLANIGVAQAMQGRVHRRQAAITRRWSDPGLLEAPGLLACLDQLPHKHTRRVRRIRPSEHRPVRVVVARSNTAEDLPVVEAASRASCIEHIYNQF